MAAMTLAREGCPAQSLKANVRDEKNVRQILAYISCPDDPPFRAYPGFPRPPIAAVGMFWTNAHYQDRGCRRGRTLCWGPASGDPYKSFPESEETWCLRVLLSRGPPAVTRGHHAADRLPSTPGLD